MKWRWGGRVYFSRVDMDILHHSSLPGLEPSNPRPTVVAPYVPCSGVLEKNTQLWDVFCRSSGSKNLNFLLDLFVEEITWNHTWPNVVQPSFTPIFIHPHGEGDTYFCERTYLSIFFWRSIGSPATADPMASKTRVKCSKTGAGGHCIAWRKKDRKNVQRVCLNWKKHGNH